MSDSWAKMQCNAMIGTNYHQNNFFLWKIIFQPHFGLQTVKLILVRGTKLLFLPSPPAVCLGEMRKQTNITIKEISNHKQGTDILVEKQLPVVTYLS